MTKAQDENLWKKRHIHKILTGKYISFSDTSKHLQRILQKLTMGEINVLYYYINRFEK